MRTFEPFNAESLRPWLAGLPAIAERLGGLPADWRIEEVGDGNLNQVFLVEGPNGSVCAKQALPYVRLVGPSWPLPAERAFYEQACLKEHGRHVGHLVPELLHWDHERFCIVMERLSPHIIMRKGMIQGIRYPGFADAITTYLARALFFTSDLAMQAGDKRRMVATFATNTALCQITEDLVFTDPYRVHERNRWTTPHLDDAKRAAERDTDLKLAVSRLKAKFLGCAEALLHGDLHTGSIMVTPDNTRVIDPEFAVVGPMGFDIGAVIGNLLLNYLAQEGHASAEDPRDAYQDWVLEQVEAVWRGFAAKFLALWRREAQGDLYPPVLFDGPAGAAALEAERQRAMARLLADTLGFAAAKMTRRILGLAHNVDLEWIADPALRAACERRCLTLARALMVETERFTMIEAVTAEARRVRAP